LSKGNDHQRESKTSKKKSSRRNTKHGKGLEGERPWTHETGNTWIFIAPNCWGKGLQNPLAKGPQVKPIKKGVNPHKKKSGRESRTRAKHETVLGKDVQAP